MLTNSSLTTRHASLPFYVTGGTSTREAPSYVTREVDRQLLDGLRRGEFCYVLTSRQMGKSSLMVRTATQTAGERIRAAPLKLPAAHHSP